MGKVSKAARDRWYRVNKTRQIAKQMERRKALFAELLAYRRTLRCAHCDMSFEDRPEC